MKVLIIITLIINLIYFLLASIDDAKTKSVYAIPNFVVSGFNLLVFIIYCIANRHTIFLNLFSFTQSNFLLPLIVLIFFALFRLCQFADRNAMMIMWFTLVMLNLNGLGVLLSYFVAEFTLMVFATIKRHKKGSRAAFFPCLTVGYIFGIIFALII